MKFKRHPKSGGPARALGVDIGSDALRVVCLADHAGAPAIDWLAATTLSGDAVKDGVVVKRREVAAQLRRLTREHRCADVPTALAIPVDQAVVRWIDLPAMNAEALAAATPFEARKYLPYPPDQAEILILPLQSHEAAGSGTMRALLAATPREVVNSRAETVELAGLNVSVMEIEPFAMVRALDRPGRWRGGFWRGQSQGYLHLGQRASGLYVMQDAVPRFVRSIAWGSSRLAQALADERECSSAEAERILELPGVSLDESGGLTWNDASGPNASGTVAAELERLCREIERLLSYYRSLYPERSYAGALSQLILCGDAVGLQGLERYFARTLQLEVHREHPFQTLTDVAGNPPQQLTAGQEHAYSAACGLALGQLAQVSGAGVTGGNEKRDLIWRYRAA